MSRTNPRIEAQRTILHQLLRLKPRVEEFDQGDIAGWERLGMAPKFYLHNGIEAFAHVVEGMLSELDKEEEEWLKAKEVHPSVSIAGNAAGSVIITGNNSNVFRSHGTEKN